MKKYFLFFFCCSFLFIIQNVIAEILPQPDVVDGGIIFLDSDDGLKGPVPNSSLTENINLINQLLEFIGLIFIIPGLIGLYLCPSLGASWLSQKYIPKINPILSWIPIIRTYPLMKSLWISGGWSFTLYIPMLPVIISELSQKMWGWIPGILSVIFLPHFTLAYVGLKENKKSTWPAWVFGLSVTWSIVIFFALILINISNYPILAQE